MTGHKVYTVVWFDDDNSRREETFEEELSAKWRMVSLRFRDYPVHIEEDWFIPDVSY